MYIFWRYSRHRMHDESARDLQDVYEQDDTLRNLFTGSDTFFTKEFMKQPLYSFLLLQ